VCSAHIFINSFAFNIYAIATQNTLNFTHENMDKCLHSASGLRARIVNFEEISWMGGWSIEGVPWRPCRFPIKQMPAGTRATPPASASISSCSLSVRQRIRLSFSLPPPPLSLSLSLSLSPRDTRGFDRRTCRVACEIRTEFTTCAFRIKATLTCKSYTALLSSRAVKR